MTLRFKPHHFLCTLAFEGKGYSPDFVANYFEVIDKLNDSVLEVTFASDAICEPCPNRTNAGCATQDKISRLDRAHAEILGIQDGERITWNEARERIRTRMSLELFHRACEPCGWKSLGICERKLKELKK